VDLISGGGLGNGELVKELDTARIAKLPIVRIGSKVEGLVSLWHRRVVDPVPDALIVGEGIENGAGEHHRDKMQGTHLRHDAFEKLRRKKGKVAKGEVVVKVNC